MKISKYTALSKLQLLASVIANEDVASERVVTLRSNGDTLQLTSDAVVVCDIDKIDPTETIEDVTVNLYQLFNIVDVVDEIIDLTVDGGDLIVRALYCPVLKEYEFKSVLPGSTNHVTKPTLCEIQLATIKLNAMELNSLKNEFYNYDSDDGFYISITGGNASFYSYDNGVGTAIRLFGFDSYTCNENDLMQYIPFRLLNLIFGSMDFNTDGITLDIYDGFVNVKSSTSDIYYMDRTTPDVDFTYLDTVELDDGGFIVEEAKLIGLCDIMTRVNKSNGRPCFTATVSKDLFTVTATQEKFNVTTTLDIGARTLFEGTKEFKFDCDLIGRLLSVTGREYLKLAFSNGSLVIAYDNGVISKTVVVDIDTWLSEFYND